MRDWQTLEREALRLHARYSLEVVEAFGLCPWASDARRAGRVCTLVERTDSAVDLAPTLEHLRALAANSDIDVAFIVYPLLDLDRLAFSHFVAAVREADAARYPIGETVLALADFHPNAAADLTSPERLVPFLRRTPDLTLQIVRRGALQEVRMSENQGTSFLDVKDLSLDAWVASRNAPTPPLAARIAKNNLRTVERMGTQALTRQFENILQDRHASYFALGLPLPLWEAHK